MIKDIKAGDRVRWESAAGTIRGEIANIRLARNAANELIPWLGIEYIQNNRTCYVSLCGLESYLQMMKFKVLFRDK